MDKAVNRRAVRRYVAAAVFALLSLSYYTFFVEPVVAESSVSRGATRWVESLSPKQLDDAITHLRELPSEYRKAVIVRALPEQRANAYKNLIAEFRSVYPSKFTRTEAREQTLNELEAFLVPARFNGRPLPAAETAQLTALLDRAVQQFDKDNISVLVGAACTAPAKGTALPARERWAHYARQNLSDRLVSLVTFAWLVAPVHAQATDCTCSQISDWCGSGTDCGMPTQGCYSSDWGCGTYGLYVCDGNCLPGIGG